MWQTTIALAVVWMGTVTAMDHGTATDRDQTYIDHLRHPTIPLCRSGTVAWITNESDFAGRDRTWPWRSFVGPAGHRRDRRADLSTHNLRHLVRRRRVAAALGAGDAV